jgi:hypothetical protein
MRDRDRPDRGLGLRRPSPFHPERLGPARPGSLVEKRMAGRMGGGWDGYGPGVSRRAGCAGAMVRSRRVLAVGAGPAELHKAAGGRSLPRPHRRPSAHSPAVLSAAHRARPPTSAASQPTNPRTAPLVAPGRCSGCSRLLPSPSHLRQGPGGGGHLPNAAAMLRSPPPPQRQWMC